MIGSYSLAIPFEAKARLIALKTALAVERYRSANSRAPPTSLDILVPHYMSTAPVDPFDEQPIRYQQRPTGFLVYSVGVDGKDDGGRALTQLSEPQGYDATVIVER